jgi:hypothetical protein
MRTRILGLLDERMASPKPWLPVAPRMTSVLSETTASQLLSPTEARVSA